MPKQKPSTQQESRSRSGKWRFVVALLFVPIVGFAAWRGGMTVHDAYLKWRSGYLADEAGALFAAGKLNEARLAATRSLENHPMNPAALRLLANLQVGAGEDLAAMGTFKKLSATRAFAAADAEGYARLAGRLGQWEVADALVKALRAGPPTLQTPLLEAELAVMRGDLPRAEARLREAAQLDSTPNSRLLLAEFLINRRLDRQTAPEVYELLVQTNQLQTPAGARLLGSALEKNLAPPAALSEWISQIRKHPHRTGPMLLAADAAEVRYDPASKTRVAEALHDRLANAPLAERRAGMAWLLANDFPARAADLIRAEEAVLDAELFNKWLESLGRANRPFEILEALKLPANPLEGWRQALHRGLALRAAGENARADSTYREALEMSLANSATAMEATVFLGRAGEKVLFEGALSRLVLDPDQTPGALRELTPVVRGWRDTVGLRRFCELLAASPGLSEEERLLIQNETAYCDLVLGRKVEAKLIEGLRSVKPGDFRFQTTRALALLRSGKSDQAVEELVITQAPPDDPHLLARHKAVQAMALAANGDRERAEMHFTSLPVEFLSTQESELVRSFLKKSAR